MAIKREAAMTAVGKLSWMPFFPKEDGNAIAALVDAFVDAAQNEDHARRIVDHIQQYDERAPMPARIRAASLETLESGKSGSCPACNGTGFVCLTQAIPTAVGTVRRCNCMRGAQ